MKCSKSAIFRLGDATFLALVFLFQSVTFNYYIIDHFNKSSFPFLWFLGDFFCLLVFSFTLFVGYGNEYKRMRKEQLQHSASNSSSFMSSHRTNSRQGSDTTDHAAQPQRNPLCFAGVSSVPSLYMAWICYSVVMIAKLVLIFKSGIPQTFTGDEFFGSSLLKVAISLSSIVFYLLVEAHHDAHGDHVRNAYVDSTAHATAIEILDTTTFISLLFVKETHLRYSYSFGNFILALSLINLMLPAVTLYKLTVSNFGRTYPVSLEILNKSLHFLLINACYLGVRLYLIHWYSSSDTSIFLLKNIYCIIAFCRSIYPDIRKLELEWDYHLNFKRILLPFQHHGDVSINGKAKSMTDVGEDIPMGVSPKIHNSSTEIDYNPA